MARCAEGVEGRSREDSGDEDSGLTGQGRGRQWEIESDSSRDCGGAGELGQVNLGDRSRDRIRAEGVTPSAAEDVGLRVCSERVGKAPVRAARAAGTCSRDAGRRCEANRSLCLCKTEIWQTLHFRIVVRI